jgi:hypothetical protein
MIDERWRTIEGVRVSDQGRWEASDGRIIDSSDLSVQPTQRYVSVRSFKLHRLICRAFHGEPLGDRKLVRHLNDDPRDNRADNLRWGDDRDNFLDRVRNDRDRHGSYDVTADNYEEMCAYIDAKVQADIGTSRDPAKSFPDFIGSRSAQLEDFGIHDWRDDDDN